MHLQPLPCTPCQPFGCFCRHCAREGDFDHQTPDPAGRHGLNCDPHAVRIFCGRVLKPDRKLAPGEKLERKPGPPIKGLPNLRHVRPDHGQCRHRDFDVGKLYFLKNFRGRDVFRHPAAGINPEQ